MDPLIPIMMIIIVCVVLIFVLEAFGDELKMIACAIIAIVAIGFVGYGLYVKVCYPAYSTGCRFISEHTGIFVAIVSFVVASVLLMILFRIWDNRRQLMATDYTRLIHRCDREIENATEALAQAKADEERAESLAPFMLPESTIYWRFFHPNEFEQKVSQCRDTLERLKDEKRYYEEQRRKADKLR